MMLPERLSMRDSEQSDAHLTGKHKKQGLTKDAKCISSSKRGKLWYALLPFCNGYRCSPPHQHLLHWYTRPGWQTGACDRTTEPSAANKVLLAEGFIHLWLSKIKLVHKVMLLLHGNLFAYRHPLLLSTTENIHPVLNSIPGTLSVKNVPQLHII